MTALLLLTTTALAVGAPEGLVSWWPANGSADDVIDENHGALDNVTYGPGMVGDAFLFDAGTGRVEIASSPSPLTHPSTESRPVALLPVVEAAPRLPVTSATTVQSQEPQTSHASGQQVPAATHPASQRHPDGAEPEQAPA